MLPNLRYDTQDMLWSLLKVKNGALSSGCFSWKAFCGNKLHSIFSSLHSSWLPVFQLPCLKVFSQLSIQPKDFAFLIITNGEDLQYIICGWWVRRRHPKSMCVNPSSCLAQFDLFPKHHLGRRGVSKRGHCDLVTVFIQGGHLTQVSSTGALFSNDKDI